jgi:hypothetical protein
MPLIRLVFYLEGIAEVNVLLPVFVEESDEKENSKKQGKGENEENGSFAPMRLIRRVHGLPINQILRSWIRYIVGAKDQVPRHKKLFGPQIISEQTAVVK